MVPFESLAAVSYSHSIVAMPYLVSFLIYTVFPKSSPLGLS